MFSFHCTEDGWPLDSSQYSIIKQIGVGAFGKVYCAKCTFNNKIVAIKVLDTHQSEIEDIKTEITNMKMLNSNNIIKLFCAFVDKTNLWMIIPYMDRGSAQIVSKCCRKPEPIIAYILKEVLQGLSYLHKNNYMHRDIKCANILLNSNGDIALSDLGVSVLSNYHPHTTFVGSPCWMSPEIINSSGYTDKTDIWSLGITALELFTGKAPYFDIDPIKSMVKIVRDEPVVATEFTNKCCSAHFDSFVAKCLNKNPTLRSTADELLKDKFILKACTKKDFVKWLSSIPINLETVTSPLVVDSHCSMLSDWYFPTPDMPCMTDDMPCMTDEDPAGDVDQDPSDNVEENEF